MLNQLVLILNQHMEWNYDLFWTVLFLEGSVNASKSEVFSEGGGATQCMSSLMVFINVQSDIYSGCAYQILICWELFAYVVAICTWQIFKERFKEVPEEYKDSVEKS